MCWFVSRTPSWQQGNFAPQVVQVWSKHNSIALQQRQAPIGSHQTVQRLVHTAISRVDQLLSGLDGTQHIGTATLRIRMDLGIYLFIGLSDLSMHAGNNLVKL